MALLAVIDFAGDGEVIAAVGAGFLIFVTLQALTALGRKIEMAKEDRTDQGGPEANTSTETSGGAGEGGILISAARVIGSALGKVMPGKAAPAQKTAGASKTAAAKKESAKKTGTTPKTRTKSPASKKTVGVRKATQPAGPKKTAARATKKSGAKKGGAKKATAKKASTKASVARRR